MKQTNTITPIHLTIEVSKFYLKNTEVGEPAITQREGNEVEEREFYMPAVQLIYSILMQK